MFEIRDTDKWVATGIYASGFAYYNKRLKVKTAFATQIISKTLPEFRKLLNIPKDVVFRIAPIKGKALGRYNSNDKVAVIDPRQDFFSLLNCIAHELVHAEQYHENRLDITYVRGKGYLHMWNGDKINNKGTTYKAYRNQPWEIEAFSRQASLAEKVSDALDLQTLQTSSYKYLIDL